MYRFKCVSLIYKTHISTLDYRMFRSSMFDELANCVSDIRTSNCYSQFVLQTPKGYKSVALINRTQIYSLDYVLYVYNFFCLFYVLLTCKLCFRYHGNNCCSRFVVLQTPEGI